MSPPYIIIELLLVVAVVVTVVIAVAVNIEFSLPVYTVRSL